DAGAPKLAIGLVDAGAPKPAHDDGNAGAPKTGAPAHHFAPPLSLIWLVGWFGYLNWLLMLANLIPALPFDGGRMVRAWQGSTSVVSSRDNTLSFYLARACAIILVAAGLIRLAVMWRLDG